MAHASIQSVIHGKNFEIRQGSPDFCCLMETPGSQATLGTISNLKPMLGGFAISCITSYESEILSFCGLPGIRSQEFAPAVKIDLIRKVAKSGGAALFLEFDKNNTPACQLYERHRFEKVGERKIIEKIKSNGPTVLFSNCRSKI